LDIETNDCWIRDYGPTFVINDAGTAVGVDWRYNAWGGKYEPWDADAAAAKTLLEQAGIPRIEGPLCLEGGAIETNGDGIVLTTPECILADTRNPGLQLAEAEATLAQYLGAREIVWVTGGGLVGDDTDGHIDQLARFTSRDHLVCAVCDDPADKNYEPLERNYRQLKQWGKQRGIGVSRLPVPGPRWINGQRVPECYCNFLITNGRVLLPTFADAVADKRALTTLSELMPEHEILPINASDLAWGLGAFHCASQQQCSDDLAD
jgi:agmatine deiminase